MSTPTSRRGRPRDERIDQAILDAAHQVFSERGYEDASLTEIARRAGVNTSAIYRRWGEKWLLALTVVTSSTPPSSFDTGDLLKDGTDGIFERAQRFVDPTYRHLVLTLCAMAVLNPSVADISRRAYEAMTDSARDRLEKAIGRGELPAGTDVQMLRELAGGAILFPLMFTGRHRSREEMARIMKVLLAGISAAGPAPD